VAEFFLVLGGLTLAYLMGFVAGGEVERRYLERRDHDG
jgi:hypothetical protein